MKDLLIKQIKSATLATYSTLFLISKIFTFIPKFFVNLLSSLVGKITSIICIKIIKKCLNNVYLKKINLYLSKNLIK